MLAVIILTNLAASNVLHFFGSGGLKKQRTFQRWNIICVSTIHHQANVVHLSYRSQSEVQSKRIFCKFPLIPSLECEPKQIQCLRYKILFSRTTFNVRINRQWLFDSTHNDYSIENKWIDKQYLTRPQSRT